MSAAAERIVATILGCGSSGGVPRVGGDWGACDPANPRNRRRRCSLLISGFRADSDVPTQILIDTGCDMREQLIDADVRHLDAVFYTHEHADHTHGIDDLRALALINRRRIDVYLSENAWPRIEKAFGYCFRSPPGSGYPPILNGHRIEAGQRHRVDGPGGAIEIEAFAQAHGDIQSLGFRIGSFAYSCDISDVPRNSHAALSNLDVWIVDALRPTPHPSHFSVDDALRWIAHFQPSEAVLTNLHVDLDYALLERETPAHVTPAYDGMQIDVTAGKVLRSATGVRAAQ